MQVRCPDSLDEITGCGLEFDAPLDDEGLADCPGCGIWFNPRHPNNHPQPTTNQQETQP